MALKHASPVLRGRLGASRAAATCSALLLWVGGFGAATVVAQAVSLEPTLRSTLDSLARAHVANETVVGVSLSVEHRGRTLLRRGYGFVDLEWGVPTPQDASASYEIGSVTKQFTAAAILLLSEEGTIDLDADFTRYVEFDTGGRSVPVQRLLDHTSGIKGYTEMPVFGELAVRDLPPDTLVRLVEAEPFDFEPGTAQIYNNSAYFLLGLIIEAVSGQSYADFVTERLFAPAGMADSYYCSESQVREGRAHGYDLTPDGVIRARYLDHTWPYAAGSLCSTAPDLIRWNQALHGGRLLSDESYEAMTTPLPLDDGTPIRYAMGLGVDVRGDRRVIQHGGGINGFLSAAAFYPDEELFVVVLQNSTGPVGPGALANLLAEAVLGPPADPAPVVFTADVTRLTGTYSGPARGSTMTVIVGEEDGQPTFQIGEGEAQSARYRGGSTWSMGNTVLTFRSDGPTMTELRLDVGSGHYVLRRSGG